MSILITSSSGNLGANLVRKLLEKSYYFIRLCS